MQRACAVWACICCAGVLMARALAARVCPEVEARERDIQQSLLERVFRDPAARLNLLHRVQHAG